MIEHWIHANYLIGWLLILFVVGGCIQQGNILNSTEGYHSETQEWVTLPSMHKCVLGCSWTDPSQSRVLTCGEEYDLETKTWTKIPNMSLVQTEVAGTPNS